MTHYTVLYVRRSDGKLEIPGKSRPEKNEPTPAQMDRTPDAKGVADYYREIDSDELKHLDWRRKLAGMLMREVHGKNFQSSTAYILDALPENYRLFEHIKSKGSDSDKGSKTHAGGGHDRQDAYLYGHPMGRKKRFRSPADFFPHLLWLCTDEAGDPGNCACKICCPDELQPEDKAVKAQKPSPAPPTKEEPREQAPPAKAHPVVEVPFKPPAAPVASPAQQSVKPQAVVTPSPQQQPVRPSGANAQGPSPLPQPRSIEQQLDSQYQQFTFRTGELVWFQRDGAAWGLGVISRRWHARSLNQPLRLPAYLVQPLSYPGDNLAPKVVNHESLLRPWLAWSPPPLTHQALNTMNITYSTLNWDSVRNHAFGPGDAVIDGSILAAKAIDGTFTLVDMIKNLNQSSDNQVQLRQWNGIFLGSERIWTGDPVRIRSSNLEDVLVITALVERTSQTYAGMPANTVVTVLGDVYTCKAVPASAAAPDPSLERHLPVRMREDLRRRNEIAATVNGPRFKWEAVEVRKNMNVNELRGRWYESTTLLPILEGQKAYEDAVRSGRIETVARKLNNRNDSNGGYQRAPSISKAHRTDALGASVPPSMTITDNTSEEPSPQELQQLLHDPREEVLRQHQQQQQQQQQHHQQQQQQQQQQITQAEPQSVHVSEPGHFNGGFEDFVNYDTPGFVNEYGGQDQYFNQ